MASTSYKIFGSSPSSGSPNLYSSGSLRPYNSGTNVGSNIGGLAVATGSSGGLNFTPQSNAFGQMVPQQASATIRNVAQADRIGQGYRQNDLNNLADNASLTDFTKQYVSSNPNALANTNQENSAIGGFYNGGVQSDLNRLADQSLAASNLAGQRALGQAQRQSAIWRMQNGDSSYADRMLGDQYSNIAIQNAVRDAAQRQQNYGTVLSGQQANLGVRNKLTDNYLQRMLVPGQTANQLLNSQLSTLGNLGNLDYANTIYGAAPQYQPPPISANQARANQIHDQILAASAAYNARPQGLTSYVLPRSQDLAALKASYFNLPYQATATNSFPNPPGSPWSLSGPGPVNASFAQQLATNPVLYPQYGPLTNQSLPQSTRLLNNGVNASYNPAYPTGY